MRINCTYAISAQQTFDTKPNQTAINYTSNILSAIEPDWKDYIPRNQLRRMGKAVRIGAGSALKLIEKNKDYENYDALIITSKNGGLQDTIKFLDQMVKYGDGKLTPTNFVQSTPNAISGNIALATKNQGFNMTHVNASFAFIDGLRDADLLLLENEKFKILIGSVEEISTYNYKINEIAGHYKKEKINSLELASSKTSGSICGESSVFFGIENCENGSKIVGYDTLLSHDNNEIIAFILEFISSNNLTETEIDTLLLGFNGDFNKDLIYRELTKSHFIKSSIYSFKDLFGEHPSAIGMGLWYANQLIKGEKSLKKSTKENQPAKRVLIFNQYDSNENSLILLTE